MESSHLLPLSALFCLAILGSHVHASLPAEDYWQTLWPNTPMPKAFKDLLVQPVALILNFSFSFTLNVTQQLFLTGQSLLKSQTVKLQSPEVTIADSLQQIRVLATVKNRCRRSKNRSQNFRQLL
ncbi:hypothetical protein Ahy_A08g040113 [Arachis hypogaea]|uniref:BURP domain-containing protein n=1 Tax=Arachis hypogaea TaxID=3818 RepID=A0A445BYK4_ARAHY|nr:hypothetical protein Ahy_A08g040113 [Arachis hypogaea]